MYVRRFYENIEDQKTAVSEYLNNNKSETIWLNSGYPTDSRRHVAFPSRLCSQVPNSHVVRPYHPRTGLHTNSFELAADLLFPGSQPCISMDVLGLYLLLKPA